MSEHDSLNYISYKVSFLANGNKPPLDEIQWNKENGITEPKTSFKQKKQKIHASKSMKEQKPRRKRNRTEIVTDANKKLKEYWDSLASKQVKKNAPHQENNRLQNHWNSKTLKQG